MLAQAGYFVDDVTGAVTPPIHPATTFARDNSYELIGAYKYSRYQNPTYDQVENLAAKLDNGVEAQLFASGMAAIATVFETIEMGQHIVAPVIMYHGAQDWLRRIAKKRNIGLSLFDQTDPEALRRAIIPGKTAIVWIETPVNPTWDVIDIADAAQAAHEAGAILGVDCTVTTPITTKALDLGADIVFHSATKYFNGHSDVIAGILVTKENNERWEEIKFVRQHVGGVIGPFEAWLLLRGMRTLSLRFERSSQNAQRIAEHFANHPKVESLLYPGLKSHPGHKIACRQMTNGFGGMLSLCVKGGAAEAKTLATKLKLFIPATSLGGVESLVEHRASVEGPMSQVQPNLLRFSIGIEDVDDLIADLEQAFESL
ncbi:MAG: aminotransferase class I/II-fold pyridoxal phosphate-dependent enzyme [Leptolyngbya sp. SIO3F4]|nr:aminotransferase class I/II-fold pyridoxal phosphate-dependent enzyme [Leptolyngbya sp. SIO3F4]